MPLRRAGAPVRLPTVPQSQAQPAGGRVLGVGRGRQVHAQQRGWGEDAAGFQRPHGAGLRRLARLQVAGQVFSCRPAAVRFPTSR